jgi:hypothetical protein
MIGIFINQFNTMSLAEELHTICFTAFVVAGTLCVFLDCRQPH